MVWYGSFKWWIDDNPKSNLGWALEKLSPLAVKPLTCIILRNGRQIRNWFFFLKAKSVKFTVKPTVITTPLSCHNQRGCTYLWCFLTSEWCTCFPSRSLWSWRVGPSPPPSPKPPPCCRWFVWVGRAGDLCGCTNTHTGNLHRQTTGQ